MMDWSRNRGVFRKLGYFGPAAQATRTERVLATVRVVLAASGLAAVYLDPTQPSKFASVAYGLLLFYVVHSIAVLTFLKLVSQTSPALGWWLQAGDLLWSCSITFFTEGPSSPFFVFFVFVLVAAAYRWGLRETLATTGLATSLLLMEAIAVTSGADSLRGFVAETFELNRFLIRAVYLALLGFLVGYLAEAEKKIRAETFFVTRLLGQARAEVGLRDTLRVLFREVLALVDAKRALLVTMETFAERAFGWEAGRDQDGQDIALDSFELNSSLRQWYLFPFPAEAWLVKRIRDGPTVEFLGVDGEGKSVHIVPGGSGLPDAFVARHDFQCLAAVTCAAHKEWKVRLFLFDPDLDARDKETLEFLRHLVSQIAPAVHNVYLWRRLRSQASAVERARVARELHDGVIQMLISIEMQVDVLRRRAGERGDELGDELSHLQGLLRQAVVQVRELMQQIKPVDLEPGEVLEFLASAVEKFGRDTGIVARFHSELPRVRLRPRVAHEVARIVQEALVNVRKHSGAKNVLVRFGAENGSWKLVVDDDGRGFDFEGRIPSAELESMRRGPMIIKERVRSIDGNLVIESVSGGGSRLEITFPQMDSGDDR
jgi:signal transduction histidine kinase